MNVLGRLTVLLATVLAVINGLGCEGLFSEVPRYVGVEVGFVQVAAGAAHTCALAEDGNVYCWGSGENGRLGDGRTTDSATPILVDGSEFAGEIRDLAVGEDHSCVVAGEEVYCWGANDQKQSGQGSSDDVTEPKRVSGLDEPVGISLGAAFSCARQADGEARCWGNNSQGQFGTDSRDSTPTHSPKEVLNIEDVELLAAGGRSRLVGYYGHVCAAADEPSTGALWCWGSGDDGQLGYAEGETRPQPEPVNSMEEPVTSLCAGSNHSCAVDKEGQVYCWGSNGFGKLGFGQNPSVVNNTATSETPKLVKDIESAQRVFCGADFNCALADGEVSCWGRNDEGQLAFDGDWRANTPQVITGLGEVDTVATGARHVCAIERGGRLYCWGAGEQGQLGPESDGEDSNIPLRVSLDDS